MGRRATARSSSWNVRPNDCPFVGSAAKHSTGRSAETVTRSLERPRYDQNPDAVYLGALTRNRICFDHQGRKMKVHHVGTSSVTVTRAGQPRVINGRAFTPRERTTLAQAAVVYLKDPTNEVR